MAEGRPGPANHRGSPGARPASGECQVWNGGVVQGRRPGPSDCASPAARGPRDSRIIYGDRNDPRNRESYERNRQIYERNREIYQRNHQVYRPSDRVFSRNGQRCVRQIERNGAARTFCADGDHDRDDRIVARAEHREDQSDRRFEHFDNNRFKFKKHDDRHHH